MRTILLTIAVALAYEGSLFAAPQEKVAPHVDARAWFKEFKDNYVAAGRKYPIGSEIVLRGIVNEVKPPKYPVAGLDDPELTFGGASYGWWIWAPVSKDYAATIKPGEKVILA